MARRCFTASPRNRSDGDELPAHEQNTDGQAQGDSGPVQGTFGVSPRSEEFHILDKDVTILKAQVNDLKLDVKDLHRTIDKKFDDVHEKIDNKFDRLMLLIIGCVALKGGFDIYREEHRGSATEKKA
ncbi:hypothetical protein HOY80DRAFT_1000865 [Tuber brumale]|nr:hypothetical protein HOY80DRAFT_1000865 [Tuber brumale]